MAYVPTIWTNNMAPPLSAANLNKLTDELRAQAITDGIANSLPSWANGVPPALTDAAPLNEMERVAQIVATGRGLSYTPTAWSSGWVPSRNAARLNRLETQVAANSDALAVTASFYASPSGLDTNPGTLSQPFRTVRKLGEALQPGQTGMLRGGTYGSLSTWHGDLFQGKATSASQRITLTNYPGESVTIKGAVAVAGHFITIRNLHFDHSNDQGSATHHCGNRGAVLYLWGNDIIFEYNEIYFSDAYYRTSALLTGSDTNNTGHRLIVRYNKIHDYGVCYAYDHGIYLGYGDSCQVYGNWFYSNTHGWGLHFYPGASRCVAWGNVIDANGQGAVFGDEPGYGYTTHDCTIYNNVFSNLTRSTSQGGFTYAGAAIEGVAPLGTGNVFRDNCAYNCPGGIGGQGNVTMLNNIVANPLFVDAANHDYRLQAGSPCANYGLPTFIPGPTV